MQERHRDRERYFEEQARTSRKYYFPYLKTYLKEGARVLEVGCGEGGNLLPFAEAGFPVTGIDISASRIEHAGQYFAKRGFSGHFIASDIFRIAENGEKFSLVIVNDVIEHIGDKVRFMALLKRFLAPDGLLFVGFPAWQMPFGGHQQLAHSRFLSHLPFFHLLPKGIYRALLEMFGEPKDTVSELLDIKRCKCPIELFLKVSKESGLVVEDAVLYFIKPHYETKFGLKPRRLNRCIASVPWFRNFFCTGCLYLMKGGL